MNQRSPAGDAEAERLLGAQLADLVRYRQIIEAQRAVVRMNDAGMLEAFSREADGLVADISAREVQLLSIRAAATPDYSHGRPDHRALRERIELERKEAGKAAQNLARQMENDVNAVTQAISEASRELDGVLSGYVRRPDAALASPLFERKG